jgi:hypothetical protein
MIRHEYSQNEHELVAKNEKIQFNQFDLNFPKVGWTDWFETGAATSNNGRFSRFKITGDEVRPRNMAIKIWKRSK